MEAVDAADGGGPPPNGGPLAYVCLLDNHPKRVYNLAWLQQRLASDPVDERVQFLFANHRTAPQATS